MLSTLFFYGHDEPGKACECWRPEVKSCGHVDNDVRKDFFETDLDDIAVSLMKVMCICRLRPWQVRRTRDAIKRAFRHYEELRYRVDRVPNKRFNKENFLHDLAVEAGMDRMDSQLAYGITKRAFRAYYHGTGEGGKRLESVAKQLRHRNECFWLLAAQRTAQTFAVYAGLLYSEQLQYEECIECIYKELYDELETRMHYDSGFMQHCKCEQPDQRAEQPQKESHVHIAKAWDTQSNNAANTSDNTSAMLTTELFFNKQTINLSKATSTVSLRMEYTMVSMEQLVSKLEQASLSAKEKSSHASSAKSGGSKRARRKRVIVKCHCPKLQCGKQRPPPVISAECSQGPYICRWLAFEEQPEICPSLPKPVICPPCEHEDLTCDDECTCTCQICRCQPAYVDSDDDVDVDGFEEEHGERASPSEVEDYDTDFCWLAPFRVGPRIEYEPTPEEAEEELEPDPCVCTCEYKRRGMPHLFTYLAPFKSPQPQPTPPPEVESEPPRVPPCGVSMDAYKCWTEPSPSGESESSPFCRVCPHIALLSTAQRPSPPKIIVTVKTQHYLRPGDGRNQPAKPAGRSSITVRRNTIAALEANMKAVQNQKPKPNPSPAKPATVPGPVPGPSPAPAPAPAQAANEDTLTKDDILEMFGLK